MEQKKQIENFKLPGIDQHGKEKDFVLSDFMDKDVVLYFYPKDDTPGCTKEACDFRDKMKELSKKAHVIGVSPDDIKSHKNFERHHSLNFPLLSDKNHELAKELGVWKEKSMYGHKYMGIDRSTFLIGKDFKIKKAWSNVKVDGHVDEIMKSLEHE